MNKSKKVYLIKKIWSANDLDQIWIEAENSFVNSCENHGLIIINPSDCKLKENDANSRYEYCVKAIQESEIIVVNALTRLGIGAGAELMLAHKLNKHIIVICPPKTHYRRVRVDKNQEEEIIHPFLASLSTEIVDDFNVCKEEIFRYINNN